METTPAYACPCCGYHTLAVPPPGSYIVCPICCWEDLPLHEHRPLPYCHAIRQAQQRFLQLGVCDEQYRRLVRAPGLDDWRAPGWQPIDAQIETIVRAIETAFADVERGDGITIHEADVIDVYGSDEQRAAARLKDREQHWRDVPDATIEGHASALTFLDQTGFHYYLPAYLRWTPRNYATTDSSSISATIYALELRPAEDASLVGSYLASFSRLNAAQARSVCRALRFLAAYGEPCVSAERVRQALDHYWATFCSEEIS